MDFVITFFDFFPSLHSFFWKIGTLRTTDCLFTSSSKQCSIDSFFILVLMSSPIKKSVKRVSNTFLTFVTVNFLIFEEMRFFAWESFFVWLLSIFDGVVYPHTFKSLVAFKKYLYLFLFPTESYIVKPNSMFWLCASPQLYSYSIFLTGLGWVSFKIYVKLSWIYHFDIDKIL